MTKSFSRIKCPPRKKEIHYTFCNNLLHLKDPLKFNVYFQSSTGTESTRQKRTRANTQYQLLNKYRNSYYVIL
jgi:hypothetical protein